MHKDVNLPVVKSYLIPISEYWASHFLLIQPAPLFMQPGGPQDYFQNPHGGVGHFIIRTNPAKIRPFTHREVYALYHRFGIKPVSTIVPASIASGRSMELRMNRRNFSTELSSPRFRYLRSHNAFICSQCSR